MRTIADILRNDSAESSDYRYAGEIHPYEPQLSAARKWRLVESNVDMVEASPRGQSKFSASPRETPKHNQLAQFTSFNDPRGAQPSHTS